MSRCISCNRSPTHKHQLDNNNISSDCKTTVELQVSDTIDDDKDSWKWISQELQGMIQAVIEQLMSTVKEQDATIHVLFPAFVFTGGRTDRQTKGLVTCDSFTRVKDVKTSNRYP